MIITRSPLRITLGGGGTDLPSYYEEHGGFLISAAIDKYVYITIHETFVPQLIIKYSDMEVVTDVTKLRHPIFREALKLTETPIKFLEIASMADIHAGTGLGSSGSFTTALLKALHLLKNRSISPEALAAEACRIELDILKEPIGKQDQNIAVHGGVTCFEFHPSGTIGVKPLNITKRTFNALQNNLLLFFTGQSRSASKILREQDTKTKEKSIHMLHNLHTIKAMGLRSQSALYEGDLDTFASILNEHWEEKRKRSKNMSMPQIDEWYKVAMFSGAKGGKLIGAGGGGFLMFYTESHNELRNAMRREGLPEVEFKFDLEGTKAMMI